MSNRPSIRPLRPGRWALSVVAGLALSGCQGALPSSSWQPNGAAIAPGAVYTPAALPGGVVVTGRVISTGGGNFIGTNTGNVISTGGGNVISTGGGNYRIAQAGGVTVILKLDSGRELTTTADAEGRFTFEIVPAAGEALATAAELRFESNGQKVVVSYPTGGDTNTTWFRFQAGMVFDLGNVTVDGDKTTVERNPLAQVDTDADGQPDATDLDDDGDAAPDVKDPGLAAYLGGKAADAALEALAKAAENQAQGTNKGGDPPGKGATNPNRPVVDTVKETVNGAAGAVGSTTGTVTETVGGATETVTDTVGGVVDAVTGGSSGSTSSGSTNEQADAPVETVVETVKETVDKVTDKLPKLPKLGL